MSTPQPPARSLPVVASFWVGSDLSWLETLCLQSYVDQGHEVVLYTPETLSHVPSGVEIRHPSEILWPAPFDITDNDRLRVAVFSDVFRLHMLRKTGYVWVDLDAYCVQALDFARPYLFARTDQGGFPTGILGLPPESRTLQAMLEFVSAPNPVQPWRGARHRRINRQRIADGESWGIEALPWGCSGPRALGHFLAETGEDAYALPGERFYPLAPEQLSLLHRPGVPRATIERPGVYSVHIYGQQKKLMALRMKGLPVPGSYLAQLCDRHGIDPGAQPIPRLDWMIPH